MSICFDCGKKYGTPLPKGAAVSAWVDTCNWCGEEGKHCCAETDFRIYSRPGEEASPPKDE